MREVGFLLFRRRTAESFIIFGMQPGFSASRPPRRRTARRRLVAATAAVSAAVLVMTQTPVASTPGVEQLRMLAAADPVPLDQHHGTVTGDGRTVYVANRTTFRPGRATVSLPPRLRARSWVVVDLDTGRLLGKNGARRHLPQASTLKLLTAITATRTVNRSVKHRVTRYEAGQICSCARLKAGRRYSRDTLLKGMLLPSGNDAAEALAGSHPQGRQAFYRAMNREAQRLGATDTVAKNASGLTAQGSHSSARDLVLLLRASLENRTVAAILAMPSAQIATIHGGYRHTVWRSTDYVNKYPGSLGKSGFTTPARNTPVVVTDIDGHRIAVATLGAPTGSSTSGARALTNWASANFAGLRAVGLLPQS
jgi:D-alanyl-D-alanine carboxypeptidase